MWYIPLRECWPWGQYLLHHHLLFSSPLSQGLHWPWDCYVRFLSSPYCSAQHAHSDQGLQNLQKIVFDAWNMIQIQLFADSPKRFRTFNVMWAIIVCRKEHNYTVWKSNYMSKEHHCSRNHIYLRNFFASCVQLAHPVGLWKANLTILKKLWKFGDYCMAMMWTAANVHPFALNTLILY